MISQYSIAPSSVTEFDVSIASREKISDIQKASKHSNNKSSFLEASKQLSREISNLEIPSLSKVAKT